MLSSLNSTVTYTIFRLKLLNKLITIHPFACQWVICAIPRFISNRSAHRIWATIKTEISELALMTFRYTIFIEFQYARFQ